MGCTVEEGLIVVPFRGGRTMGALRLDLPSPRAPEQHDAVAAVVVGALSRLESCDAAAFVVYADTTFPVAFASWEGLIHRLEDAAGAAGFPVKEALCAAVDGYASWKEDDPPFDGHPVADIEESPLAAQAAAVRGGRELPRHGEANALPPADPVLSHLFADAVDALLLDGLERDAFGRWLPRELPDPVESIERALSHDPDRAPLPLMVGIAALALLPDLRDQMTLQIAFGRAGLTCAAASGAAEPARRGRQGEAAALLFGEGVLLPELGRMRQGAALLRRIVAHMPADLRPDLLLMLGWQQWAQGQGTAAADTLQAALRIAPGHVAARVLLRQVGAGKVPEWVFRLHGALAAPPEHADGRRWRGADGIGDVT